MQCSNGCGVELSHPGLSMYVADEFIGNAFWGHYCSYGCALEDMGNTLLDLIKSMELSEPTEAVPDSVVPDHSDPNTPQQWAWARDKIDKMAHNLSQDIKDLTRAGTTNVGTVLENGSAETYYEVLLYHEPSDTKIYLFHNALEARVICETKDIDLMYPLNSPNTYGYIFDLINQIVASSPSVI